MKLKDAVNSMIKYKNESHASLSTKLGYKSPASVGNPLSRGNLKVNMLIEWCNQLGYEIVLRPKSGENKAGNTFILDEIEELDETRVRK